MCDGELCDRCVDFIKKPKKKEKKNKREEDETEETEGGDGICSVDERNREKMKKMCFDICNICVCWVICLVGNELCSFAARRALISQNVLFTNAECELRRTLSSVNSSRTVVQFESCLEAVIERALAVLFKGGSALNIYM